MPLIGGGGAGNTAGSNPTGTGGSLNFIGDHCFANSGVITVETSDTTVMQFDISNVYIMAKLSIHTAANSTNNTDWRITINGEDIMQSEFDNTRSEQYPSFARPVEFLIPPYSKIRIHATMTTGAQDWTAILTGRVYE